MTLCFLCMEQRMYFSSISFCFFCAISISRFSLPFFRALSFFFQSASVSITLRRAISVAILHFCRICSIRSSRLMLINLRSSRLTSLNNFNLRVVLHARSFSFRILSSSCSCHCCRRLCLSVANFSLSFNLNLQEKHSVNNIYNSRNITKQKMLGNISHF